MQRRSHRTPLSKTWLDRGKRRCKCVDLGLQPLRMAVRRHAELILGGHRPDVGRLFGKACGILQIPHQRQYIGPEQVEAVAIAVGVGQGKHDAAGDQRENQDAGEIANPNRMNELSIVRHARTPTH
jgi:hypothetical protein